MIQILRPDQNLEDIRFRVSESTKRPVFIVGTSNGTFSGSTLYKEPGARRYTTKGNLELFMSRMQLGVCVRREQDTFYYDLSPSDIVRIVYPLTRDENPDPYFNSHFVAAGIASARFGSEGIKTVFLTPEDRSVAPVLDPFVAHYRTVRGDRALGVKFCVSGAIETPNVLRDRWHHGITFGEKSYVAQTIQAPGHYYSENSVLHSPQAQNRMCLVDTDPGKCVRCAGSSGHRVHLGVVVDGNPSWADGLVCRGCYPEVSREWVELLATWTPPEKSPST